SRSSAGSSGRTPPAAGRWRTRRTPPEPAESSRPPTRSSPRPNAAGAAGGLRRQAARPTSWCSLIQRLVHVVRELLGRDGQTEQLLDVVQQGLCSGRAERLVPGLHEVGRLGGDVVDELQPVGVLGAGELLV